ncbi:MAG TPA: hypothetical protein VNB29_04065 [Chthoniobacterales bacterium]|nr:hypothetical protein [Chthoniobacterales bacterium]
MKPPIQPADDETVESKLEKMTARAMKLGHEHLADYGSTKSRKDFTQSQLVTLLVLRTYLQTTYRTLLVFLANEPPVRKILGMEQKLPHYTTLQKFGARADTKIIAAIMAACLDNL